MALTQSQITKINKSNKAMQDAAAGTLLAALETASASYATLTGAPVASAHSINGGKTIVTIPFDKALYNATADTAALKAKVTFASNGTTFVALGGSDTVEISGFNLVVTFNSALTGSTNKIKIGASAVKSPLGVVNAEYTTGAIA